MGSETTPAEPSDGLAVTTTTLPPGAASVAARSSARSDGGDPS